MELYFNAIYNNRSPIKWVFLKAELQKLSEICNRILLRTPKPSDLLLFTYRFMSIMDRLALTFTKPSPCK